MKKRVFILSILLISLLCFFSCSPEPKSKVYYLNGFLSFAGINSSDTSRTASPTVESIDLSSLVIIVTVENTKNSNKETETLYKLGSFSLKLNGEGPWKISAKVHTTDSAQILFSTPEDTLVTLDDIASGKEINLSLTYSTNSAGAKGNVALPVKIDSNTKINYLNISCSELSYNINQAIDDDNREITFGLSDKPAGSYNFDFSFYNKTEGSESVLLYKCSEVVNVVAGFNTSTWINSGNSEYLSKDENGILIMFITQNCVNNFIGNTFYISSTGTDTISADGHRYGSYEYPFKTVQYAINYTKTYSTGNYLNFLIKDAVTEYFTTLLSDDSSSVIKVPSGKNYNFMVYSPLSGTKPKVQFVNKTSKPFFIVNEGGILNVSDIILDGAKNSSVSGANNEARTLYNEGTVNFTNVTIQNSKATGTDGAIIKNKKNLTLDKCVIGEAKEIAPDSNEALAESYKIIESEFNCVSQYSIIYCSDDNHTVINDTTVQDCLVDSGTNYGCLLLFVNNNSDSTGYGVFSGDTKVQYCKVIATDSNSNIIGDIVNTPIGSSYKTLFKDNTVFMECSSLKSREDLSCTSVIINAGDYVGISGKPSLINIHMLSSSSKLYVSNMASDAEDIANISFSQLYTGDYINVLDEDSKHCDKYFTTSSDYTILPYGKIEAK